MRVTETGMGLLRRVAWPAVLLFATAALPAVCADAPPAIRICAYNVRNWLSMDRFDGRAPVAGAPKPESEREAVVSTTALIKPDILGICEVGTREDLADLQARLKAQGLDLPHSEFAHGGDPTRSLALLSRLPIAARLSQTDLQYQMGAATLPMQRGILHALVDAAPRNQIHFVGVHLKSKRPVPEADEALMRRNEAHLVRQHLNQILASDPAARIVCYGDFNSHRNEPALAAIIGNRSDDGYMTEVPLTDEHGQVWTHFWDAADNYSRFDYFFVSRTVRPLVAAKASFIHTDRQFLRASDHRPIVLTLKIPRDEPKRRAPAPDPR